MLVSGRGSQDVRSTGGLGVFRELASAQGLAFPELLKKLPPVTQPKGSANISSLTQFDS
jgi:hypothetical protein